MENHIVSIELSQKLKELGVKQESQFVWRSGGKLKPELQKYPGSYTGNELTENNDIMFDFCSAFLSSELGEMLPATYYLGIGINVCNEHTEKCTVCNGKQPERYYCIYDDLNGIEIYFEDNNEADARAKMLIYLIENNLIEL